MDTVVRNRVNKLALISILFIFLYRIDIGVAGDRRRDQTELKPFISIGLIKTSNLGAFEQYLNPGATLGAGSGSNGGSSIGTSFPPSSNSHNVNTNKVSGGGALGQIGVNQEVRLGATSFHVRYGLLAFFDATDIGVYASSGWGVFTNPINAVAHNKIDAVGLFGGVQVFEHKGNRSIHQLSFAAGGLRNTTMSNLLAESISLNVDLTDQQSFDTPLFMFEYEWRETKYSDFGIIADILAFRSPYLWNVGLSIGIKKTFE